MKNILCAIFCLFTTAVHAQHYKYHIIVKVKKLNKEATLIVDDEYSDKQISNYYQPQNGVFNVKGIANDTSIVRIRLISKKNGKTINQGTRLFFLLPGTTIISADSSLNDARISGSKDNQDLQSFIKMLGSENDHKPSDSQNKNVGQSKPDNSNNEKIRKYKSFIKDNPTSLASLAAVQLTAEIDPNEALEAYQSLSKSVQYNKLGKMIGNALASRNRLHVGAIAPDISQKDTAGHLFTLSSLRGKYVLVNFWASWCPPCRIENKSLVEAFSQFHSLGLEIVSVSLDRPGQRKQWLNAINDDHLNWYNVSDLKYMMNDAAVTYGVQTIPDNFLLDPAGKIVAHNLSGDALKTKLTELLQVKH